MKESKNLSYLIIFQQSFIMLKPAYFILICKIFVLGRNNDQSGW